MPRSSVPSEQPSLVCERKRGNNETTAKTLSQCVLIRHAQVVILERKPCTRRFLVDFTLSICTQCLGCCTYRLTPFRRHGPLQPSSSSVSRLSLLGHVTALSLQSSPGQA
ncbi:UNVERIFIED_CONTAM: hypothetical protein FKN15_017772 [Acipenser sinensis]